MFLSGGAPVRVPVDSLGDTTPMYADANYYASNSLQLTGMQASYAALYKTQLWVYALIRKIAVSAARLPLKVYQRTDVGREPAAGSAYGRLIARPNPRHDSFFFWLWTVSTFELYGEAIWLKVRGRDGQVIQLHPMHPSNTSIHRNSDGSLMYVFESGARNVPLIDPISERDVVHFKGYNPENLTRGLSQLEPLRQTLLNEDAARRAMASWWTRGARPSVALIHPNTLSQPAADRLKANWDRAHAGADNFGGTAVLEEGMEPKVLQLNAEEMQYIEGRKLNREEVCGACDVPPPVVHILDRATFSNITEQMRSMYRDTMAPRLGMYESTLEQQLRPDFDETGQLYAEFLLDEVLRGAFETRADSYQMAITSGWMKPSEVRAAENLPDAGPEADHLYGNAALVPLGSNPQAQAPSDGQPMPQALRWVRPIETPAVRSIMGRVGRVKASNPQVTKQRLIDEHRKALVGVFTKQRQADSFDPADWNDELEGELLPLSQATAKTFGSEVAKRFGGSFALAVAMAYLQTSSRIAAENINDQTKQALEAADDPAAVWDDAVGPRADHLAESRVTSVANFGEVDGARQAGARNKSWVVNSDKPRPSHAAIDGETVPIGESFSIGARWPGDPEAGVDEVAGCTCTVDFSE